MALDRNNRTKEIRISRKSGLGSKRENTEHEDREECLQETHSTSIRPYLPREPAFPKPRILLIWR